MNSTPTDPEYLDLRGLKCPLPVLRTGKALDALQHGWQLEVRTTDPMSVIDIPHLVHVRGDRLVAQSSDESGQTEDDRFGYVFLIERVCADRSGGDST